MKYEMLLSWHLQTTSIFTQEVEGQTSASLHFTSICKIAGEGVLEKLLLIGPRGSMYGMFTYMHHKKQPNVGKYTIHGFYGGCSLLCLCQICERKLCIGILSLAATSTMNSSTYFVLISEHFRKQT